MNRQELARLIKQTAYLQGEFTLRSGRKSNYYLDKYLFETQPRILAALAEMFAGYVDSETQRIAAAELGGVPLAVATSLRCGLPYVIVRSRPKDYGTARAIEGLLQAGDQVLLLEDVTTTGGQILQAARRLESAGARIRLIAAVIDRGDAAQAVSQAGYRFVSLFTAPDLGLSSSL